LKTEQFRRRFYPSVPDTDWNDWQWQLRHRIQDGLTLSRMLRLSEQERAALEDPSRMLPRSITPYYLSLLDPDRADDPLRRSAVPTIAETWCGPGESDDPLSKTKTLRHRTRSPLPDRSCFWCPPVLDYCRYCTGREGRRAADGLRFNRAVWKRAWNTSEHAGRARRADSRRDPPCSA
jgi:lysine 2,3-aminomutase